MANINVNRSITDQFYRYKMPRLIAKVEGKGNGIKTVIVNMAEIAKALSRPPTYPTKYFGCELGAQTQFNVKDDRYIVNGAHDALKLQDLLDGFIKKFVLCPECDNPETNLQVLAKKGVIVQRCIACGHQCNVDMRHKLTTFIVKNPPDVDPASTPSKKEKGKKGRGKGKDKDAVNGDDRGSPETTPEAQQPGSTSRQTSTADSWDDDDDWGEDVSDAAVKQRMEELTDAAKALALSEELEKTQQERLDLFYEFVKTKKAEGMVPGADKELVAEAERLDVKDKGPLILVELLLDENILASIKLYRNHFLRFTHENAKAQKYLLGGMEQLIGNVHKDTLMPKVPHILKLLYDTDLLEEEVLLDWHKKVSKKYVSKEVSKEIHAKAEPFIKWLQEAEEEESESEEEEVEVVYSHTEKVGTHVVKKEEPEDEGEEEEDEFDIDAI
jgi:translation initiation factor 5